jgi:hypothetical protein
MIPKKVNRTDIHHRTAVVLSQLRLKLQDGERNIFMRNPQVGVAWVALRLSWWPRGRTLALCITE